MAEDLNMFIGVMVFYLVLSYVVGPLIGYYAGGKSLEGAGHGFVLASLVSVALWYVVGKGKVITQ